MTVDSDARVPAELRRWAAELLDVPADAKPEQARTAAARKLADWDFTPPDRWQHAAELLASPPSAGGRDPLAGRERPLAEVEHRLRQQVEDFAAGYFRQPPGERSRNWHALRLRAEPFPLLLNRLKWLERGLSVEPQSVADKDPHVVRLAREVAEVFVLPPAVRAARRDDLLRGKRLDAARWEKAAKGLRSRQASLAALDGDYLDALVDRRMQQQRSRKLARAARPQAQSGGMFEGNAWKFVLAFWLVLGVVRACNHAPKTYPTSPYRTPANYSLPSGSSSLPSQELQPGEGFRRLLNLPPGDRRRFDIEMRDGRVFIKPLPPTTVEDDGAASDKPSSDVADSPALEGAADVALPSLPRDDAP